MCGNRVLRYYQWVKFPHTATRLHLIAHGWPEQSEVLPWEQSKIESTPTRGIALT